MKKLFLIGSLAATLLLAGCSSETEKVVSRWPDGTPQIVQIIKGSDDNPVKVCERHYYANGQLQCDKHYESRHGRRDGQWCFYYPDGTLFADAHFDARHQMGYDWSFHLNENNGGSNASDSIVVAELGENENPATVYFYRDSTTILRQYYSTGAMRSEGALVGGLREGVWHFFFSNGMKQVETTYRQGKEEGMYTVYRENGVPYYRGMYHDGRRTGVWELYDEEANLASTQQYN